MERNYAASSYSFNYRLNEPYAASSYLLCLVVPKGVLLIQHGTNLMRSKLLI
jgi:hypothetical protein